MRCGSTVRIPVPIILVMAGVLESRDAVPQLTASMHGAEGAREVAAHLDRIAGESIGVLHDRRVDGDRSNIDHIVVAPSGVYVVSSMPYDGRVERRDKGTFRHVDLRLWIGNRDRSHLLDGVARQATAVRRTVGMNLPLHPVLCFVGSDWGVLMRPFHVTGVLVTWPKALVRQVQARGPLTPNVAQLALELDSLFPPATAG
jgi:hypothetical protein